MTSMTSPFASARANSSAKLDVFNRTWKWIALIGLLLLATFLRFHRLDQLPPVVSYDEAYNGIEAQRILRLDYHPLFFEANGGRMPLFIYSLVGPLAVFGSTPWALRLVSVVWGLLAIPCVYQLGRALFQTEGQKRAQQVGVLAAACVAVLLWHAQPSRTAIPSVQLLPTSALTVLFFWRAWHGQGYKFFGLSGLMLGVTVYTHLAGRVAPVVLASFVVVEVLANWRGKDFSARGWLRHRRTVGCILTGLLAAVVFAPMAVYFFSHPGAVTLRSQDLYIFGTISYLGRSLGAPLRVLANNVLLVVRMFIDRGDMNEWYNVPGRPALDPLMQVGFLAGLVMALVQLKRPRSRLLLIWLVLMLLPTILSIEAPHFTRAAGAIVPVAVFVAAGWDWLWASLGRLLHFSPARSWPVLVAGVALVSGGLTYDAYFNQWAGLPVLERGYREAEYAIAQRAFELSQTADVALPLEVFIRPSARFILETTFSKVAPLSDWPAGHPTVLLAPDKLSGDALVVLHRTSAHSGIAYLSETLDETAAQPFRQVPENGSIIDLSGHPVARVVPGVERQLSALVRPRQPVQANFDNLVQLSGYDLWPASAQRGDKVHLTLYWECLHSVPQDYDVFVHLVDAAGNTLAQFDNPPLRGTYPTNLWSPGEVVADGYDFTLPKDIPAGKYRFDVGLYSQIMRGQRLAVTAIAGQPVNDNHVLVGVMTIPDALLESGSLPSPLEVTAGQPPLIKLAGYDLDSLKVKPGQALNLVLYWQTLQQVDRDYTVFVHLQDEAGQLVAQQDSQPEGGRSPTSLWNADERVIDRHQLTIGAQVPPGRYTLSVGLYDWANGQRLALYDGQGQRQPDDSLALPASISVEK